MQEGIRVSKESRILVLGNSGSLGGEICMYLKGQGYMNIQGSHDQDGARRVNLQDKKDLANFLSELNPDVVIMAATYLKGEARYKQLIENTILCLNVFHCSIFNQPQYCVFIGYEGYIEQFISPLMVHANKDIDNRCRFIWSDLEVPISKMFSYG